MSTKGPYPFADKTRIYRGFSDAALAWSIKDAAEARDACATFDPVAEAWYADDVATIGAEIQLREKRRQLKRRGE